mmetsp:Transcript_15287/g.30446  ORF Transcript_15287/g.30446 Transcript_15287/m.30446 type:complete len:303 (+) Transcript_15287:180-1088(+)
MSLFSRHSLTKSTTWVHDATNPAVLGRRSVPIKITFRHNMFTGSRQVLVDGATLPGSKGWSGLVGSERKLEDGTTTIVGDEVKFDFYHPEVKRKVVGKIVVLPAFMTYDYQCFADGAELASEDWVQNQSLRNGTPAPTASSSSILTVGVSGWRVDVLPGGEKKVRYRLLATLSRAEQSDHVRSGSPAPPMGSSDLPSVEYNPNQPTTVPPVAAEVWKSFSEQLDIANILKTSYRSSHLASSFPPFPPRVVDPWVDQTEEEFLKGRKAELEVWWAAVVRFPRVVGRLELLRFLGLEVEAKPQV